jgi:hypothetical protein
MWFVTLPAIVAGSFFLINTTIGLFSGYRTLKKDIWMPEDISVPSAEFSGYFTYF